MLHFLGRHVFAVNLQHPSPALSDATVIAEHHGRGAEAVIFEVKLDQMLAGGQLRPLPAHALEVNEVPGEYRLVLQDVEAVSAEPPALRDQHAFGASLRNVDVRLEIV